MFEFIYLFLSLFKQEFDYKSNNIDAKIINFIIVFLTITIIGRNSRYWEVQVLNKYLCLSNYILAINVKVLIIQ